ncbi:acetyltransferase (GNAT) family protein [Nocardia nova SH22a]|uniref:Acetyltransferase (GNAT) family protein n=1 Tax=Nocardia nova SH22a TaxID=1415166 RepID=W5THJ7_9NOCA|nr:GNAT family N-acetyltransferase [Nocardia nova]AHH18707.1 acetyltransferase (GNAT) family protein [Nocardia nova SH22a]
MVRSVFHVRQSDPMVAPLLAELAIEYSGRYGGSAGEVHADLVNHPAADFAAPHGDLLVVVEDGEPVAGGAFRRYDEQTAELKRIWTAREHRRRGLATFVLAELEAEALRRGYRRIFLTTGPRQPEAVALYRAAGYTPLERTSSSGLLVHPFEKYPIGPAATQRRNRFGRERDRGYTPARSGFRYQPLRTRAGAVPA